jgi:hypothetical protein
LIDQARLDCSTVSSIGLLQIAGQADVLEPIGGMEQMDNFETLGEAEDCLPSAGQHFGLVERHGEVKIKCCRSDKERSSSH